jgi:diguanylate cyclase (GGDEF)-like protein
VEKQKTRHPRYKILIVDDDISTVDLLIYKLSSEGHQCDSATNAKEALEKFGSRTFDAVITDIVMPGMDGITLTRKILKKNPDIPIMVMTGFIEDFSIEDALDAGAMDFIKKPFFAEEISIRFHKMMNDHKQMMEQKDREERLKYLAYFDSLTGLPNRSLFLDRLNQTLALAKRNGFLLGLLFLDLDYFKQVNDTLGHLAGDMLLKEAAARLRSSVRNSDTVARLGGDEFTVLLSKIKKKEDASIVAAKIIESFSKPFVIEGHECTIGASIGVSLFNGNGEDPNSLLMKADDALQRAKGKGRNTYQFY